MLLVCRDGLFVVAIEVPYEGFADYDTVERDSPGWSGGARSAQCATLSEMTECGAAYQYVGDSTSSRMLSENLGPLLAAGKPILVSDPFVYDQFLKHGLWPDSQVENLLRNRYFDLIVMTYNPSQARAGGVDTWLASLATVIEQNYKVVRQFDCRDARIMLQPIPPGYGP